MDDLKERELNLRNKKIIDAIIRKSDKVCPGSIALVGVAGSFQTGDYYEKSDLDLCIVVNDNNGNKVSSTFIIEDIAFDIYCVTWEKLERAAEYDDPYVTKILQLKLVYYPEEKSMKRYMDLRERVKYKLSLPFSAEQQKKAEKLKSKAKEAYADIMLAGNFGECRYAAAGMLYYIELAIYMYNNAYVKKGIKRVPEEIAEMKNLPDNFMKLYRELICASDIDEIRKKACELIKTSLAFAVEMKNRITVRKEADGESLTGTYEEIYSNWKNKMHHAAENNDPYLSLMTAASCQMFYNDTAEEYNIPHIDLMSNMKPQNLDKSAREFDIAMEKYRKNYDRAGIPVAYYADIEAFVKDYLA